MRVPRLRLALLALASGAALSGCAYDMYGDGYGYRPYGGVSVGYGGYGGYGYGGYGGYGYGYSPYGYGYPYDSYGYDPFGWYGDYYYPGVGIYVYDRHRNRHPWNGEQRRHWEDQRSHWQQRVGESVGTTGAAENWTGWDRTRWRNTTSTETGTSDGWRGARGASQTHSSVPASGMSSNSAEGGSRHSSQNDHEHGDERPQ